MEKIELRTRLRGFDVRNIFNERYRENTVDNTFFFEKGRIYGLVCECGGGGDAVSLLLSGREPLEKEGPWGEDKIYIDGVEAGRKEIKRLGWYVGSPVYLNRFIRKKAVVLRASLAIGYACGKKIYCFPWMNTYHFYYLIHDLSVFRFFRKLKEEGCIIILPTSRRENVEGFADEVIRIHNPDFEKVISDSECFKECF